MWKKFASVNQKIEIDSESGFCFGVTAAIRKAEEELEKSGSLFCLGDIVHNASEVERLRLKGLKTITHADLENLHDVKVLLRAHGEPPETYEVARRNNIEIIDATCPVVLQLQRRVKTAYTDGLDSGKSPLILIYGKHGHAEVNGLVGQTRGEAVVVQDLDALKNIDIDRDVVLFSQTTKSLDGFHEMVSYIKENQKSGSFRYFDTICRQVSNRLTKIREFAADHDVVLFVSGAKSSNGKVLYEACRAENPRTYLITDSSGLDPVWVDGASSVGVCGATSTPRWLMQEVADALTSVTSRAEE